ncbi:MAG: UDP-3-O-acyl-N-acetylglucosamine deacetylase [Fimbriimonadales bacterium]
MKIEFERRTVANPFSLSGHGIHTGEAAEVTISPGDRGVWFHHEGCEFPGTPTGVSKTPRSTWIGTVRTVEHLMSAMAAFEITDAEISLSGPEMPILGGGSAEYCDALSCAGSKVIGSRKCSVFGRVQMLEGNQHISVSAGRGRWRYLFKADKFPGDVEVHFDFSADDYSKAIAPSRTWCFESEVEQIRAAGLGKGGNEENTLIIGDTGYCNAAKSSDEPARHKLLDCIGDLSLAGIPVQFLDVVAESTGHEMNVKAATRLAELCTWEVR